MIVENKTTKSGYSSFMINVEKPESLLKMTECCSTIICKKLCHTLCPKNFPFVRKIRLLKWLWRKPKIHTRERNRSF